MTNPTTPSVPRIGATTPTDTSALLQGGASKASVATSYPTVPIYLGLTSSGSAAHTTIDLSFTVAMKAGTGPIWVTDGAVQSVIDAATGGTSLRIVGATDTHLVSSSLRFDGDHVFIDAYNLKPGLNYSVIIAPGALVSTADKAFAGLRSPGYAMFSAPGSDTTGPTLESVQFDSSTVKVGHDIQVTLTFSEKVAMPDATAFNAPHAQLTGLDSEDGVTWYGWLRATEPGITATGDKLGIDMTKVRDLAGNAGTGTVTSASYDVDTVVTTHVSWIGLYDDAGPDGADWVTNGSSQLIEGTINGRIGEGQRFELLLNGHAVDRADITLLPYPEGSVAGYSWSYVTELAEGAYTLVARIVEGAHSSGEVVRQIAIDNTAPVFTSNADGATAFGLDAPVVIRLAEKVYWERSEGSDDAIEITDREGNVSYRPFAGVEVSEDGLTLTIPASVLALTAGNDYTIRLPATLTDLAGNNFGEQAIHLQTAGEYVDVMPPRAVSAKVMNHAGTYGVGAVIEIRVKFNEPVALVEGAIPTLALNNGGTATFLEFNGANEMVFKYVVAPGHDTWELDIRDYASLLGSVADLAGHRLDHDHVEFWYLDNDTADNWGSDIVIVTTGPAPLAAPRLDTGSDTGTAGDRITLDNTPTFSGEGAASGAAVFLYDGDRMVASGTAGTGGSWSLTPSAPLGDGTHLISVRHADSYGNLSVPSVSYSLTIDTVIGTLPAPSLAALSDSGLAGDNITSDSTPTLVGAGAEPGALIELYVGTGLIASGSADASGHWSVTPTAVFADGGWLITAVQVDAAGNRSVPSSGVVVNIDTTASPAPTVPTLLPASDSGAPADFITNFRTLTFTGNGAAASAKVELFEGDLMVGEAIANALGEWTVTTVPLGDGNHTLTAKQVDTAGNRSTASSAVTVQVDTVAAAAPTSAPVLDRESDSGSRGDNITQVAAPKLTGSGVEAGAKVELYLGAHLLGTTSAGADGTWSLGGVTMGDGTHTLTARQVDAAGNRSEPSVATTLTIDTRAAAPEFRLSAASDSGASSSDGITNVTAPTFSGTAEANSYVQLFVGEHQIGDGYANAAGVWSITSETLESRGAVEVTAQQTDVAGNTSARSAVVVTIDTNSPWALIDGNAQVAHGETFRLTFNEKMDMATIGTVTVTTWTGGEGIGTTVATYLATSENWHVNENGQTELWISGLADNDYVVHMAYSEEALNQADLAGNSSTYWLDDFMLSVGGPG